MSPVKTIVIGPRGKMGRLITQTAFSRPDMELTAAIAPPGADYIGQDLGTVALLGSSIGLNVTDSLADVIDSCDVIIDFSTKENAMQVLELAVRRKKALVCGTTGFSKDEMMRFEKAGADIPILYAANTSKLVNIMNRLLPLVIEAAGTDLDVEIIEMHDRLKKDAPSGTSKEMGRILADAMNESFDSAARYGREGVSPRENGSICYHSVRAGSIPSSHTVLFGEVGERLEITHHAYNWECFAKGACDCAVFLSGKPAGFYTIQEM